MKTLRTRVSLFALTTACSIGVASAASIWTAKTMPPCGPVARLLTTVPAPTGGNGVEYAKNLLSTLRANGYPAEHLTVDERNHVVYVSTAVFPAEHGWLASYLPPPGTPFNTKRMQRLSLFLAPALEAHNKHLSIHLPQMGAASVEANPAASPAYSGGFLMSSSGPRYAGSDVATVYGWAHVDGTNINASITRGISNLTPKQSRGGAYLGEAISLDHPTPYGTFSTYLEHSHYLTGGPTRPLHIKGTITQFESGWRYPITQNASVYAGVLHIHQIETIGIVGFTSHQDTTAVDLKGNWSRHFGNLTVALRGALTKGISGTAGASRGPIYFLGPYSNNFLVERIHLAAAAPAGPGNLLFEAGAQHGPYNTPAALQAYIGGEGRGNSLFSGTYAGPSGYWGELKYTIENILPSSYPVTAHPYASASTGFIWPVVGKNIQITSVTFGFSGRAGRHLTYNLGLSHTIKAPSLSKEDNRFVFLVNAKF